MQASLGLAHVSLVASNDQLPSLDAGLCYLRSAGHETL